MKTKGVFRKIHGRDKRTGKLQYSQKHYVGFRDHLDRVHRTPAFTDRKASEEYMRRLRQLVDVKANGLLPEGDLLLWINGLPPEYLERIVNQFGLLDEQWLAASELLTVHLADYCESIKAAGRTAKHIDLYRLRIKRLLDEAKAERWSQLTTEKLRRAWSVLTAKSGKPLSQGSRNHYLTAFTAFSNWMVYSGRATTNPVKRIKPLTVTDKRERHPFTPEEFVSLVDSTRRGPVRSTKRRNGTLHFQLSGSERVLFYATAAETALRLGELNSLRVCDFDLNGDRPYVQLRAASAKNRKAPPPCPLLPELAEQLRAQFEGRLPGVAAFNGPGQHHAARMLRADMAVARAEWIAAGATPEDRDKRGRSDFLAPEDHRGRFADFHAIRTTVATWLAEAAVSPYAMQKLMRHAKFETTEAFYVKVRPDVVRGALEQLPKLRLAGA